MGRLRGRPGGSLRVTLLALLLLAPGSLALLTPSGLAHDALQGLAEDPLGPPAPAPPKAVVPAPHVPRALSDVELAQAQATMAELLHAQGGALGQSGQAGDDAFGFLQAGPTPIPLFADDVTAANGRPTIRFDCPPGRDNFAQQGTVQPDTQVGYGCPVQIYDRDNAFADIDLAVHPSDPNQVFFTALHGRPVRNGPTDLSRDGMTHTTFITRDGGASWSDRSSNNGYPQNQDGNPSLRHYAEGSSGAYAGSGNQSGAFLWSTGTRDNEGPSLVGLFKASDTNLREIEFRAGYMSATFIQPRFDEVFRRIHTVSAAPPGWEPGEGIVEATEQGGAPQGGNDPQTNTSTDNETINRENEYANATDLEDHRFLALWVSHRRGVFEVEHHDEAIGADDPNRTANQTATGNKTNYTITEVQRGNASAVDPDVRAWVDIAYTGTHPFTPWRQWTATETIGHCKDISEPVPWRGAIYFVCVVDGADPRPITRSNDLDLIRLDPWNLSYERVSRLPIEGENPRLSVTDDGFFALLVSDLPDSGLPEVRGATGWYGKDWEPMPGNFGPLLHAIAGGGALIDAGVTAMVVTEPDHLIWIVYKEWYPRDVSAPNVDPDQDPDPEVLGSLEGRLRDYSKTIIVLDRCSIVAGARMQLGTTLVNRNDRLYESDPQAFNDGFDGLATYYDDFLGQDVVYFAIGDYGSALFGTATVTPSARVCTPPLPPFTPLPVSAAPNPLVVASSLELMVGAVYGTLAVATTLSVLATRRKSPHVLATEAGR